MWSGSFTKNAQAALTLAEKTAARLHTGYVGTNIFWWDFLRKKVA